MQPINIIRKILVLAFAFVVFVTIYAISKSSPFSINLFGKFFAINISSRREVLPYMGIMLMVTLVYIELLIVRDHLWVIEGSLHEVMRWRDAFFNKETLRKQRLRKILVVIFSTVVFTYVYITTRGTEIFSFLGIILMITVLYFETLSIRDDLKTLNECFQRQALKESIRQELLTKTPGTEENIPAPSDDGKPKTDDPAPPPA
jgi:hypothetical protein